MKPKAQERGQALVIIALAVVGLFGFSALAIDGSRVFSDRRNAQNAADTAALSAALTKIRGSGTDYQVAAIKRAASNGYVNDADSTVEVTLCSALVGTPNACQGLPTTASEPAQMDPANYIQVKITSIIPATFARIVGRNQFTNIVTAVAYSGPVEPQPVVRGAALAALKEDGDATLFGNGTVNLSVIGSGVFNNSADACATTIAGAGSQYSVTTSFQFVGYYCRHGGTTTLNPITQTSPIEYPPTFNIPEPNIACSGNGSHSTDSSGRVVFTPGNYPSGQNFNWAGPVIFQPGNYCFGNTFKLNGPVDVIANDVNIRVTNGEFSLNGGASLTCNDMLVHIDGGSGMSINGTSEVHCNDVTFFASTGNVVWDGNATVRMFAPKGGLYKGLLIYLPYGNNSDLTITGNSNNELTGSIIAVSSAIQLRGVGDTTGLHSQIIGYTVEIQGSHLLEIHYDPDEQYWEVDPTAITLTK
jgi:Flp pilus assembly protein TadG